MGMLASRNARIGLGSAAGGFLLLILGFVIIGPRLAPSTDRARAAYERRDWSGAASIAGQVLERRPDDLDATRIKARALARLGDAPRSLPLFARLGGAKLGAEDLLLVGEAIIREGRPDLGRSAIEAATRLDPKHAEAVESLDRLARKAPSSKQADRLLAVPDAPTLAELIVGLAAMGPDQASAGAPDPMLDRVLQRDRATLARLDSPAAARRLLARILLEGGRASEARERLDKLDDPEAHWLLGRAALVDGDSKTALTESSLAGRFGLDDPMAPEPSRYVGASQCAGCHKEIYRTQQSSHHAGTVAWGEALKSVPLPDHEVVDPRNPGVVHQFTRSGSDVRLTSKVEGKELDAVIEYAMGSGNHGITMLARGADGRPRSLRISYYSAGQHWGLTSGFEPRPVDPSAYVGEVLNEESFRNCLNCHTTRFSSERSRKGPEWRDHGIGCERCHGPGDHHVRAVESGFDRPAIARPRLATPAARMKLCGQCHGSDGVIPPADPRFIRFQAATLPYSRCVTESSGRLDCVGCHDPHKNLETSAAYYEAKCLTCHGGPRRASAGSGFPIEAVAASQCPVDPKRGCLTCHMPKVANIMPFTSFTDHHIRVHKPAGGGR